jgi:rhizosphere induced protein
MGVVLTGFCIRGGDHHHVSFKKEEVDRDNRLTDASVNCNLSRHDAIIGLPARFDCYAEATVFQVIQKGGRIIEAPLPENQDHCLLSGITLKDANNLFSHVLDR